MNFIDSVFNALLSREQRERVSRNSWDKSVAQSARVLDLEKVDMPLYIETVAPTSCAMAPTLSASSSRSSSSGMSTPARPSTSYSTSPRPEFRRHLSIARQPISYDALIASKPTKPRRASNDAAPQTHQLLYPLPPLGPMQGIGKYRRSVDVTDDYLNNIQRNTIEALQPFIQHDERLSRFRCGDLRDTTTPPRAYSTSPPLERQLAMQCDLVRMASEMEADAAQAHPIIEEYEEFGSDSSAAVVKTPRPARVANRRRAQSSRGAKRLSQQSSGNMTRNVKSSSKTGYKPKNPSPQRREIDMSASMETLVSGEE